MTQHYPSPAVRRAITVSVMAATLMNSLDTTIANVALPHIQGSVSASADEISWVLTSYIIAAAIMTPLSGWLADRFGRKRVLLWSIIGFTIASALCGLAVNLGQLILFRMLQGVAGASLIPLSQSTMLDMNPREEQAKAMGIWSMAALVGPILGPTVGGWLTEALNWRWVFYINLPVGVLAALGVSAFMEHSADSDIHPFDLFGFALLGLGLAALQMMLDRGQTQDWFNSTEICIEAALAAVFFAMFAIHTATTRHPFLDPRLLANRNFMVGCGLMFFLVLLMFGVLAMVPPMLETLMGYPVVLTGMVTAPRGIGSLIPMAFAGSIQRRLGTRLAMTIGFVLMAASMYVMSGYTLDMDMQPVIVAGFVQGVGSSMIFVPMSLAAYGTLDPALRNRAASLNTLVRSLGSAAGISILQAARTRATAAVESRLSQGIRPDNPVMQILRPDFDFGDRRGLASVAGQIARQAAMASYDDIFWALFVGTVVAMPCILLFSTVKAVPAGPTDPLHMD